MPSGKLVTMQDIANELHLSKMTVSAVLTGKADRMRISLATQERVREAAKRLGYRPNEVARSLRRRSTNIIGFYMGHSQIDPTDPWMYEIIGGLQEGCRQHRKDLLLHTASYGLSVEDIYASLLDGRVDGLICYAPLQDPLAERLRETRLPVVAIVDALPDLPSVMGDDVSGSRLLARYLAEKGHKSVLYCPQEMEATSVHQRQKAFFEVAAECGLRVENWGMIRAGTEEEMLRRRNALPPEARWTALAAWDDQTAYRLWAHCRKAGIAVPNEIAIVGFDGVLTPMDAILRLTTIRAPWPQVARLGVDRLIQLLQGEEVPTLSILPVELIAGDTA